MGEVRVIPLVDEGLGNSAYLLDLDDGRALAVDATRDLRALHDGPAIVVGYSMGGPIAQLLTRRHPELVAGNPGIGEEGHFAQKSADIRPAHAHAVRGDEGLSRFAEIVQQGLRRQQAGRGADREGRRGIRVEFSGDRRQHRRLIMNSACDDEGGNDQQYDEVAILAVGGGKIRQWRV